MHIETSLDGIVDQVTRWCATADVVLLSGEVPDQGPRQIIKVVSSVDKFFEVLEGASRLRPSVATIQFERLGEEVFQDALADNEADPDDATESDLEEYREAIGHLLWVNVTILTENPQLILDWSEQAPWADPFLNEDAVAEDDLESEEESTSEEPEHEEHVRAFANELAESADFALAKNNEQRTYVAKKVLSGRAHAEGVELSEVLPQATAIYEVEVKPRNESSLIQRAQSLRREGFTIAQISEKLAVPAKRLHGLLRGH